jgi:hypothetical protein
MGFEAFNTLKQQLKTLVEEQGGKILQEELKKTLELMPEIEAIVWTQNHNVYNDEGYAFESSGFAAIPTKDCLWRENYALEIAEVYDLENLDEAFSNPEFYGEAIYALGETLKKVPEHAERIAFVEKTLNKLIDEVPQEVLETFDDVAVKVTRDNISFEEFSYRR